MFSIILAFALIISLVACGNSSSSAEESGVSIGKSGESNIAATSSEDAPSGTEDLPDAAKSSIEEASVTEDGESTDKIVVKNSGLITTDHTYDLPLFDEDYSFSMWVSFSDNMSTFMPNGYRDNKGYMKAEELTGVKVDLIDVPTSANSEQFSLRVASGDLPNVITNVGMLWTGSFDSAIDDEIFIDLTDMVENYMPAYKECYDQLDDVYKRALHTDSGYFPKITSITNYPTGGTEGAFIRTDYLEQVGMDIPTTYEELDAVLKAFQTELNLPEPLMAPASIVHTSNVLVSGFDVCGTFSTFPMVTEPYYIVDGEVKYGIVEPGFKEYMEMFSEYYESGIIHPDFISKNTNPMEFAGTISSGDVGVFFGETMFVPNYIEMGKSVNPDFEIAPLPPITKEEGQVTHFGTVSSPIDGRGIAAVSVSTADTDLEKLGTYLDFFFTEEGALLSAMGVEGEDGSYVYDENGKLQYSDNYRNYEGLTEGEKPTLFIYSVMPMLFPETPSSYTMEIQFECSPVWNTNADTAYQMPTSISMTADEIAEYQTIYGDIQTLIEENLTKFAVGDCPMSEWDSFVEQLMDMGIDNCIAIKQDAVERFNHRSA